MRAGREEAGGSSGACSKVRKGRAPRREAREGGQVMQVGTGGHESFQEHVLQRRQRMSFGSGNMKVAKSILEVKRGTKADS